MDFLLTELNFLMEVINFKKVEKDMKSAITDHLKQTIKIAERKQVFQKQQEIYIKGESQRSDSPVHEFQKQLIK